MYLKEEGVNRAKIEKMKAEGKDEHDVKKQIEVLNDTLTVIPDTRQRLQKYATELRSFLDEFFRDFSPEVVDAAPGEEPDANLIKVRDLVLEGRQHLGDAASALGMPEE